MKYRSTKKEIKDWAKLLKYVRKEQEKLNYDVIKPCRLGFILDLLHEELVASIVAGRQKGNYAIYKRRD